MKPVRIGCSGWMYDDWRGRLYPEREPKRRWLELYAERFDTVEVNSTFYRLARRETVAGWVAQTPGQFPFAVKASRYLTHVKRLVDIEESIKPLLRAARAADRRGQARTGSVAAAGELPPRRRAAAGMAGGAAARAAHDRVPPPELVRSGGARAAARARRGVGDRRSSSAPVPVVRVRPRPGGSFASTTAPVAATATTRPASSTAGPGGSPSGGARTTCSRTSTTTGEGSPPPTRSPCAGALDS